MKGSWGSTETFTGTRILNPALSIIARAAANDLFIYDDFEKTGTVYTKSRKVFDHFYELKPFSILWSEMRTEHKSETYDLYTLSLDNQSIVHSFNHPIIIAEDKHTSEIERFMAL